MELSGRWAPVLGLFSLLDRDARGKSDGAFLTAY